MDVQRQFQQVGRKLDRARAALLGLGDELADFDRRAPYRFVEEPSDHGASNYRFQLLEEPNPEWEITVGEAAYQARSALDQLVALMVTGAGGDGTTSPGGFPISASEETYRKTYRRGITYRDWMLEGTSEEFRHLVDRVQPFATDDPPGHPLLRLHELCNADKHRSTHAVLSLLRSMTVSTTIGDVTGGLVMTWELPHLNADDAPRGRPLHHDDLLPHPGTPLDQLSQSADMSDPVIVGVVGVCFGARRHLWADLVEMVDFIQVEVVARVAPLVSHD